MRLIITDEKKNKLFEGSYDEKYKKEVLGMVENMIDILNMNYCRKD